MRTTIASLLGVLFIVFMPSAAVLADPSANGFEIPQPDPESTPLDLQSIRDQTPWYDPTATACSNAGGPVTVPNGAGDPAHGTWNSGLQPPYILEQFMIELLKDIAAKTGTPVENAVTLEHVEALVTFAYGEGGGITNNDFWNPFNTGINAPDLLATDHAVDGVQAFKSFDAGVEATARVMTKGHPQSRMSIVLTNPNSTVKDFYNTLVDFKSYEDNGVWATASLADPTGYVNKYISLSKQTIDRWPQSAGLIMRGAVGDPKGQVDSSKLVFHPTPSGTSGTNDSPGSLITANDCVASGAVNNIVGQAQLLAWPNDVNHGKYKADATPTYQQIEPSAQGSGQTSNTAGDPAFSDCGVFVATVMRSSGADPKYQARGTSLQLAYLLNHPEMYLHLPDPKSSADLQPGDILVTTSGTGHTYLYTGPWGDKDSHGNYQYNAASASFYDHVPEASNFYQDGRSGQHFTAFRYIGKTATVL